MSANAWGVTTLALVMVFLLIGMWLATKVKR